MGHVEVVDRGSREIVVFLSGSIDSGLEKELEAAVERVTVLERVNDLHRVVIDTREVTAFDRPGVRFVRRLESLGRQHDFDVALSMSSRAVLLALHPPAM